MGTIELTTKRLILRRYKKSDVSPLLLHFGCNAKMYEFSGWNPYATEEMAAETVTNFINSYNDDHFYGWAIEYENELIGTIGAYDYDATTNSIEVGISIKESCWGHGFATEALICVLDYLTNDEKINTVTAWCAAENTASIMTMEKAGMRQINIDVDALEVDGIQYDKLNYCYSV